MFLDIFALLTFFPLTQIEVLKYYFSFHESDKRRERKMIKENKAKLWNFYVFYYLLSAFFFSRFVALKVFLLNLFLTAATTTQSLKCPSKLFDILSLCHFAILPFCHFAILPLCHFAIVPFCQVLVICF